MSFNGIGVINPGNFPGNSKRKEPDDPASEEEEKEEEETLLLDISFSSIGQTQPNFSHTARSRACCFRNVKNSVRLNVLLQQGTMAQFCLSY